MSIQVPSGKSVVKYTYKDYLNWPDEERWEIIDGVPYSMSPAPSVNHQRISREIGRQFANYLLDKTCEVFDAPFDVRLAVADEDDTNIQTVVQPDIVVLGNKSKLDERGYRGAPALIVELVSPATAKKDLNDKFNLDERSGVKEYWVVFPLDQVLDVYVLDEDGKYQKASTYQSSDQIKIGILPELEIGLSLVFQNRIIEE